jgi:hypothetical protein
MQNVFVAARRPKGHPVRDRKDKEATNYEFKHHRSTGNWCNASMAWNCGQGTLLPQARALR